MERALKFVFHLIKQDLSDRYQAGDTREVASLDSVFGKHHSKGNPLYISSIKGNIGHCEAASGAASLAKLLLMMRKGELLPQAGLKTLNPRLTELESGRMVVPRNTMSWKQQHSKPRRAMLNNFGAAGSNTALLLEEYKHTQEKNPACQAQRSSYVFNLSARSRDALKEYVEQYKRYLDNSSAKGISLEDLCYTATARRESYDYRISLTCDSIETLRGKLLKVNPAEVSLTKPKKTVVFVFSGQGSIYASMGQELMHTSQFFKDTILQCDRVIQSLGFPSISEYITNKDANKTSSAPSDRIIVTQCACVALEYALAKLLISWGITPDYMIGHR